MVGIRWCCLGRGSYKVTLPKTNIAMENPPFWWYLQGNMGIFMGYVSFREVSGKPFLTLGFLVIIISWIRRPVCMNGCTNRFHVLKTTVANQGFFLWNKHQQGESLKLFTGPNIFPRHPGPPPEVRYLDPKNIPKTPSQELFGCLGFWKLDVPRRHSLQRGKHHSLNLEILLCFAENFRVNYSDILGVHLDFRCWFLFIFHLEIFHIQ